jgi:hypothetical protein
MESGLSTRYHIGRGPHLKEGVEILRFHVGKSLFGSSGGCPPFGEASVNSTPASRKTKYGAANSSSQKPVLRPVLPN